MKKREVSNAFRIKGGEEFSGIERLKGTQWLELSKCGGGEKS